MLTAFMSVYYLLQMGAPVAALEPRPRGGRPLGQSFKEVASMIRRKTLKFRPLQISLGISTISLIID